MKKKMKQEEIGHPEKPGEMRSFERIQLHSGWYETDRDDVAYNNAFLINHVINRCIQDKKRVSRLFLWQVGDDIYCEAFYM